MYNEKMIQYVGDNYKKITNTYGYKFHNYQAAEDCLQHFLYKLLKKDYDIKSPEAFLKNAMIMIFMNYKRTNRRYAFNSDSLFDEEQNDDKNLENRCIPTFEPTYIDDINFTQTMDIVYNEISKLPNKQREAILNRIAEKHNWENNTEKTNYRQGIIKLKIALNNLE